MKKNKSVAKASERRIVEPKSIKDPIVCLFLIVNKVFLIQDAFLWYGEEILIGSS